MFFRNTLIQALALAGITNAQVSLGSAAAYGVIAASTITNTGSTIIGALIGLSPGTSITGFPPGVSTGQDVNDDAAITAMAAVDTTYSLLLSLPVTTDLSGKDLGGLILTPGVYRFSAAGQLTGILTLDAQGSSTAQFVLQFATSLTTASASSVILINGAQGCNVFWQVGSSATFGTGTAFVGNVLAAASITAGTSSTFSNGGLYAITGAVTLDTNTIDLSGTCAAAVVVSSSSASSASSTASSTSSTASSTSSTASSTSTSSFTIIIPTTFPITIPTIVPTISLSTVSSTTSTSTTASPSSSFTTSTVSPASTALTSTTSTTCTCTATITASPMSTTTITSTVATKKTTFTLTYTAFITKNAPVSSCPKPTSTNVNIVTASSCVGATSTVPNSSTATVTIKATAISIATKWVTTSSTITLSATTTPVCTT